MLSSATLLACKSNRLNLTLSGQDSVWGSQKKDCVNLKSQYDHVRQMNTSQKSTLAMSRYKTKLDHRLCYKAATHQVWFHLQTMAVKVICSRSPRRLTLKSSPASADSQSPRTTVSCSHCNLSDTKNATCHCLSKLNFSMRHKKRRRSVRDRTSSESIVYSIRLALLRISRWSKKTWAMKISWGWGNAWHVN